VERRKSLLKRIRAGILWTRAIGKVQSGHGAAAIILIERIERLTGFKAYHVVMLARAEIIEDHFDEAVISLKRALSMMGDNESANARYLKLHAEALLSLMEGGDYDALASEAASIECTPRLRCWFPTPERPQPNSG